MPNGNRLGSGVSYELSTVYSEEFEAALGLALAIVEIDVVVVVVVVVIA